MERELESREREEGARGKRECYRKKRRERV